MDPVVKNIALTRPGDPQARSSGKVTAQRRTGAFSGLRREETIAGYLFLLPNLIGFLIFSLIPIVATFGLTLTNWNLIGERTFVGLENYQKLIDGQSLLADGAQHYRTYTLGAVPIGVFIAFWLALLLNRKMRGVVFFRTVFFLPYVTLTVAIAIVWAWIYHPELGLVNYLLGLVGIDGPRWLQSTTWAMPAIIIMSNWKGIGYAMLIFLAGLQAIPQELLEAATIDGASRLPASAPHHRALLAPTTFFILVTSFIGGHAGVRPVLCDDAGWSRLRHDDPGHVHLPERLRVVPDGLRGDDGGGAVRQHLRHHRAAVAVRRGMGLWP